MNSTIYPDDKGADNLRRYAALVYRVMQRIAAEQAAQKKRDEEQLSDDLIF